MKKEEKVSTVDIIVLVKDSPEVTAKCFRKLKAYTNKEDYRLIAVDQGSSEATKHIINKYADKVIALTENIGFTKAVNLALNEVKNPFFCLLNNDVLVTPSWLQKLRKKLEGNEKAGAIGAISNFTMGKQMLMPEDRIEITAENYLSVKPTVDPKLVINPVDNSQYFDWKNLETTWNTDILCFFAVLFKSEVIKKIGKLDEVFSPAYSEDLDYSFRMREAGYELLVDRETFVYHYGEVTSNLVFGQDAKMKQYQIGNQKLQQKWGLPYIHKMTLVDPHLRRLDPNSVTIGIPNTGTVSHYFLMDTLGLKKTQGTLICDVPKTITHMARQEIAKFAIRNGTNYIFFIDSDVRFPPDVLIRFLAHRKDLVGGVVTKRVPPYNPCVYKGRQKMPTGELGFIWFSKAGLGLQEIDGIGMALTLIDTKVFRDERLTEPYFYFKERLGEDLIFCDRIKKLGYELYCDTDVLGLHEGEPQYYGWNDYIKHAKEKGAKIITGNSKEEVMQKEKEFTEKIAEKIKKEGVK